MNDDYIEHYLTSFHLFEKPPKLNEKRIIQEINKRQQKSQLIFFTCLSLMSSLTIILSIILNINHIKLWFETWAQKFILPESALIGIGFYLSGVSIFALMLLTYGLLTIYKRK